METTVWIEILCASCNEHGAGCFVQKADLFRSRRRMIHVEVRSKGWIFNSETGDWNCKRCSNVKKQEGLKKPAGADFLKEGDVISVTIDDSRMLRFTHNGKPIEPED